jgi:predicted ATP-binding protein involved in virulence
VFEDFFKWYREQTELENDKIVNDDPAYSNKQLAMVKRAVLHFLPGFSDLRIRYMPARLAAVKGSVDLSIDQLSDGEKNILSMIADIARRLVIANPESDEPLSGEGLVLIDEIDAHLHPTWQTRILLDLQKIFPQLQFIITTHSPAVLREFQGQLIELYIENGKISSRLHTPLYRWDINHILESEMDTSAYNRETESMLTEIFDLIDDKMYDEAEQKINIFKQEAADYPHPEMVRADLLLAKGRNALAHYNQADMR